jgi:hypothetical protein
VTPDEFADRLDHAADRLPNAIYKGVAHTGMLGVARIRGNASGRPGPNVITGAYRNGWQSVPLRIPYGAMCTLGTDRPQGRRLEWGFTGTDSLGRHYCVDVETEILTKDGWLRYDQITDGAEALTLNMTTWESEWQPITHLWHGTGQHSLVLMENGSFSALTTPDHRWPIRRYYARKKEWITEFRTTERLTSACRIPRAVPCSSLPTAPTHGNALVELVAWFWTEGSYDWGRKDGESLTGVRPIGISLSQSQKVNPENVDLIDRCLFTLFGPPGRFTEGANWHRRLNEHTGVIQYRLDRVAAWLLRDLVSLHDKAVSPRFIASLTEDQLHLFLDRSMRADGTESYSSIPVISQRSENRLRSFEMACALVGQPTNTRVVNKRTGMVGTSLLGMKHCNPQSNASRTDGKAGRSVYERVQKDTTIWCPTTPNGTWLARRRGAVYFTGNSQPPFPHVGPAIDYITGTLHAQMRLAVAEALT